MDTETVHSPTYLEEDDPENPDQIKVTISCTCGGSFVYFDRRK